MCARAEKSSLRAVRPDPLPLHEFTEAIPELCEAELETSVHGGDPRGKPLWMMQIRKGEN